MWGAGSESSETNWRNVGEVLSCTMAQNVVDNRDRWECAGGNGSRGKALEQEHKRETPSLLLSLCTTDH